MPFTANRFYFLDGPGDATTPSAGGHVDGVAVENGGASWVVHGMGMQVSVEAGGSFASGTDLATDGNGRAVAATSGDVRVARALEGSGGSGSLVKVVLAAQQEV